jgi:hypothetical protein
MRVFIKKQTAYSGAWYWIYNGYASAWKSLGYDVYMYDDLDHLKRFKDYYLMAPDSLFLKEQDLDVLNNSSKTFLFVQPNNFPHPWGLHENYFSWCNDSIISSINKLENVKKWTFVDTKNDFYHKWRPATIPLAFDSIGYTIERCKDYVYDICYIGGRANNGYDEKIKIIQSVISKFEKTNLKCGFFVNRNISHDKEKEIISSSKLCLNIHDAYQRVLSLDTNERTFKSLGINGTLLSDDIKQIKDVLPDANIYLSNDTDILVQNAIELCNLDSGRLEEMKNSNIEYIKSNHTYCNRINSLLSL